MDSSTRIDIAEHQAIRDEMELYQQKLFQVMMANAEANERIETLRGQLVFGIPLAFMLGLTAGMWWLR